jgi:choline dehydrogenase-like flavoprotein
VGGTTVINSGTCVRTPEAVLAHWRDALGVGWAPELAAEFDAIERDLAVTPLDPALAGRNAEVCRAGADALGALNRQVSRNAGHVARCATCPTGCSIDAKQAMHVSELPRAVAAGARIRSGMRVEKVIVRGGRAVGIAARPAGGRAIGTARPASAARYAVEARAVVLAAGAIGTPELLLRQRIARSGGPTGRNLHIQPACWVGGRFEEPVRGWEGVMQSWHVDEWRGRGLFLEATFTPLPFGAHWLPGVGVEFKERVADYGRMAMIGVHLADKSSGRVTAGERSVRMRYRLTPGDAEQLRFGIARAAEILFAAGATEVYPQLPGLPVLEPGGQSRIEHGAIRPSQLRLEAFHPMGTAAAGPDRATAGVDLDGQSHDLPGLYVMDASVLPTALGVNPMITIIAAARRLSRGLAEELA